MQDSVKEAMILCGGKGKRLHEHTHSMPKALVEIGNKPILWHIINYYKCYGINKFILCVGYKGELIEEYLQNSKDFEDIKFIFSDSGLKSTKANRILEAKDHIAGDNFVVAYGDDLSDVDLSKLTNFHLDSGKIATLTAVPLVSQFGILSMDDSGIIEGFKEKPRLDHWFNGGFFIFNRKIFDYMQTSGELESEVFNKLIELKELCAFQHDGHWKCMNTLKDSEEFNALWNENLAFWKCWKD